MKKMTTLLSVLMAMSLLMTCFPAIAAAEEKGPSVCVASCIQQKNTCYNIQADKRVCEVAYQECINSCEKQEDPSSPAQPKPEATVN